MSFSRASLSCLERLSAIFDGLVLRMSHLSNCMKSSNPRSQSLFIFLHINNNRDSIHLSMEQHLIEKAGTLQNSINRTCDH